MYGELTTGLNSWADWADAGAYSPNLTPTFYTAENTLNTSSGHVVVTSTGLGKYPLALKPEVALGFVNTKCMFYSFAGTGGADITDFGGFTFTQSGDTTVANGMIARVVQDNATIGKYRFRSISGIAGARGALDQISFDFTTMFSNLSKDSYGRKDYYWFPEVKFNIVKGSGSFQVGGLGNTPIDFQSFSPPILTTMYLRFGSSSSSGGVLIDTTAFDATIAATELYTDIYITQNTAAVGDTISIICPATAAKYDFLGMRTGFDDLVSITFPGAAPVTNFTRVQNTNKVNYAVQVKVPVGAKSGIIQMKSVLNNTSPALTTDIFSLPMPLTIV